MTATLLLIDDEDEILEFLERILGAHYRILKAVGAGEGLALLKKEVVQLVVSDVLMPDMDGFELCRLIKSDVTLSHIPVILLTAMNTIQAKVEGLELGADAYIEKPFSPQHLRAQISSLLVNRELVREYFAGSPLAHVKTMAYSKADERFLESINDAILTNMENQDLDIDMLARILNMSRATLYRKVKAISDLSTIEFINIVRLKKAAILLTEGDQKIYEVALQTGFSSQSNFARNFHKQFNMTPTEYRRGKKEEKNMDRTKNPI